MADSLQMQRAIGVADIETFRTETRRQKLSAFAMPAKVQNKIFAFLPHIRTARHSRSFQYPWLRLNVFVRENAKGRDDVFRKVLVLIVAPDQNKIRLEFIQRRSN